MAVVFSPKNSGYIQITGLVNRGSTPPAYLNDAVLKATLVDSSGTPVVGFNDVTGVYIDGSNGTYKFSIPDPSAFNPPLGGNYSLIVTADAGDIGMARWVVPAQVTERGTGLGTSI